MTTIHTDLGELIDRDTIRFVRHYPHPIELVWEMLTEPDHLKVWFMSARLDLRVGGSFVFGPDDDPHLAGVITAVEPPRIIEFANRTTLRAYGYEQAVEQLRFELTAEDDGCRLDFTQRFPAGTRGQPGNFEGSDIPVPGTPWRPGFLAGYHDFLERLGSHLDGRDVGVETHDDRWRELNALYRRRILDRLGS
jgi:uncharacterized protein YndB with AHSA1/START domain